MVSTFACYENVHIRKLSSASFYKLRLIFWQKLPECQTVWLLMRCRVTWHLIRIQAVSIWHYGWSWQAKNWYCMMRPVVKFREGICYIWSWRTRVTQVISFYSMLHLICNLINPLNAQKECILSNSTSLESYYIFGNLSYHQAKLHADDSLRSIFRN